MDEKIMIQIDKNLPVPQQQIVNPIVSKPLVISRLTKRFLAFPKRSILVKPVPPTNFIITTQPQKIFQQSLPKSEIKIKKKPKDYRSYCKNFNDCCQKVNGKRYLIKLKIYQSY